MCCWPEIFEFFALGLPLRCLVTGPGALLAVCQGTVGGMLQACGGGMLCVLLHAVGCLVLTWLALLLWPG